MSGKTEVEPRAAGSVTSKPSIVHTAPDPGSPWETRSACCAVSEPPTFTRSTITPGTSRSTDHGSVGRGTD